MNRGAEMPGASRTRPMIPRAARPKCTPGAAPVLVDDAPSLGQAALIIGGKRCMLAITQGFDVPSRSTKSIVGWPYRPLHPIDLGHPGHSVDTQLTQFRQFPPTRRRLRT